MLKKKVYFSSFSSFMWFDCVFSVGLQWSAIAPLQGPSWVSLGGIAGVLGGRWAEDDVSGSSTRIYNDEAC